MQSILEEKRFIYESLERVENLGASILMLTNDSETDRIEHEQHVLKLAKRSQNIARFLLTLVEQQNLNQQVDGKDFSEFYSSLRELKDQYRRFEPQEKQDIESIVANLYPQESDEHEYSFTGEENLGGCLDLHELHEDYINLPNFPRVSYLQYLDIFLDFSSTSFVLKSNSKYSKYLDRLHYYLKHFLLRSQPLLDFESIFRAFDNQFISESNFEAQWDSTLKADLSLNLFCNVCVKQFIKKAVYDAHLTNKKHRALMEIRITAKSSNLDLHSARSQQLSELKQAFSDVVRKEFFITQLGKLLSVVIAATKEKAEQKLTLTESELLQESIMHPTQLNDSDKLAEYEDKIYNPLKLPIGWDGKPIPYWLYKLHGLGVEYSCEICGGYVYMGRKAFERHFQEWRHATGMKCLGIPNLKHFQNVTSIADAQALWKQMGSSERLRKDQSTYEEVEDQQGNVMNKQTYDDLFSQGLL